MNPPLFKYWSLMVTMLAILAMLAMLVTPIQADAYYQRRQDVVWNRYFDAIIVDAPNYNNQDGDKPTVIDSVNINNPSGMIPSGVPAIHCHYIRYYYDSSHYSGESRSKASAEYKVYLLIGFIRLPIT